MIKLEEFLVFVLREILRKELMRLAYVNQLVWNWEDYKV